MAYFPFMVEVEGMRCLIVGGGKIAYHKLVIMRRFGVQLCVTAPEICGKIRELAKDFPELKLVERGFRESDLEDADIVIAATNDKALNHFVSVLCREKRIPVNAVDQKEDCSFVFPAMIKDEELVIAVSTGGNSPAAAGVLKRRIQEQLPEGIAAWIGQMGDYRDYVRERVHSSEERKKVYYELFGEAGTDNGSLTRELVEQVIARVCGK